MSNTYYVYVQLRGQNNTNVNQQRMRDVDKDGEHVLRLHGGQLRRTLRDEGEKEEECSAVP